MTSIFPNTLQEVYDHIDKTMADRAEWLKQEVKKDRYDQFMASVEWWIIRDLKLSIAGYRCEQCNAEGPILDVHHLTYERFGGDERMTDLHVLCRPCHNQAHGRKF